MVLVDGKGAPLGLHADSASPSEVKLRSFTLAGVNAGRSAKKPERLIGDRGCDSKRADCPWENFRTTPGLLKVCHAMVLP